VSGLKLLLVEDDPGDARLVRYAISSVAVSPPVEIVWTTRLAEARERLAESDFDVCLLDLSLPDAFGLAALKELRDAAPDLPVVILTGLDDDATALSILRQGAQDYLLKGRVDGAAIMRSIRYARERHSLENELRQSRERFENLAHSASDWFWETDADDRFTWFSERLREATGLDPGNLIGKRRQDLIRQADPDELARFVDDLAQRRPFRDFQFAVPLQDRQLLHIRASGVPVFDRRGEFTGYRGTATDITRLKAAETELKESRLAAERASQAKSAFLANMSHELRTPLNAILGFAEIMVHELMGPLLPKYHEYSRDILLSGSHLLEVINDILDVSKVEAGKWKLRPEPLDLGQAIDDCLLLVETQANEGGITVNKRLGPDLPPLTADRRSVKQCLLNLLSNAVKFTPVGGTVTVVATRDDDGAVIVSITDTGIGIPEDDLPRLLHPFEQVDSAYSRRLAGTGLGLALTKSLIEMHGGCLSIASEVGRGTQVDLRFPREVAAG